VVAFEHGFQALQARQYGRAADLLSSVVNGYPDEKELQERARVYLRICERQKPTRDGAPRSFDDRVNAATIAVNRGALDEGLSMLRKLEAEDRASDHVQYMLSVAHTLAGDTENALVHLRQAVDLNPENRFLATQDGDLEDLRRAAGFAALLEAPLVARRRVPARRR
jgi:tetratricopeptide (TPR) repeat protein